MFLVPLSRPGYSFWDRQRDLFPSWIHLFDDDWRETDYDSSFKRFEDELDRLRLELHQLHKVADEKQKHLEVEQPFVTDPEGNKKLSLRFDCSQYKPEEVEVKVKDGTVSVHAKHEEEKDGKKVHREFHRMYRLPKEVDEQKLKATLAEDGVLAIEAPMPQSIEAPKEHTIPIEKLEHKEEKKEEQKEEEQKDK